MPEVVIVTAAAVAVLTTESDARTDDDEFVEMEARAEVVACADTLGLLVSLELEDDEGENLRLADSRVELVAQRVPVDDGELDLEKNDADAEALFDGDADSAGDFDDESDGNEDSETDTDSVAADVVVAERENTPLVVRAADALLTREPVAVIDELTDAENIIDGDDDAEVEIERRPVAESRIDGDELLVPPLLLLPVAESRVETVAEKEDETVAIIDGDTAGENEEITDDDELFVDVASGDDVTAVVPEFDCEAVMEPLTVELAVASNPLCVAVELGDTCAEKESNDGVGFAVFERDRIVEIDVEGHAENDRVESTDLEYEGEGDADDDIPGEREDLPLADVVCELENTLVGEMDSDGDDDGEPRGDAENEVDRDDDFVAGTVPDRRADTLTERVTDGVPDTRGKRVIERDAEPEPQDDGVDVTDGDTLRLPNVRDAEADGAPLPEVVDEADLSAVTLPDDVEVALNVSIAEPEPDAAAEADGIEDSLDMGDFDAIDAVSLTDEEGVETSEKVAALLRDGEVDGEADSEGDKVSTAVEDATEKDATDDADERVECDTEREPELEGEPLCERDATGVRDVDSDGTAERDTVVVRLSAVDADGLIESDGDADEEREIEPLADVDGEFVDDALVCELFEMDDWKLADAVKARGDEDTDMETDAEPLNDGEPLDFIETDGDMDCVGERVMTIDADEDPDIELNLLGPGEELEGTDGVETRDCVEQEERVLGSDGMSVPREVAVSQGDMESVTEKEREPEGEPESESEPETVSDTDDVRVAALDVDGLRLPVDAEEAVSEIDEHGDDDAE